MPARSRKRISPTPITTEQYHLSTCNWHHFALQIKSNPPLIAEMGLAILYSLLWFAANARVKEEFVKKSADLRKGF